VRVALSAINPSDVKTRAGYTPRPIDEFQIPHMDGAGRIEAVGPGVDEERVGERVWLWGAAFQSRWGTAAEYCVVDQAQAVRLPDAASLELGACLGVPAITAHECLLSDGPIKDARVLVAGGAGAVGHFAVEIARWSGARVASTVSNPEKARLAHASGADVVVNYREPGAVDAIRQFGPIDRFVEVALVDNFGLDLEVAAPRATIVTYATDGRDLALSLREAMRVGLAIRFFLFYTHPRSLLELAAQSVTEAAGDGALTALPITSFPLEQFVEAHELVESGTASKVVLDLRAQ